MKQIMEKNQLYGKWIELELRKNELWVIISPVIWVRPTGEQVHLTPFLITDYASIPDFLQFVFPKRNDTYDLATAFHDDCIIRNRVKGIPNNPSCHRIFNELAKKFNTPSWQRRTMYRSVQLFGILQHIRLSIFPSSKKYHKYFGWELTDEEIFRYNKIKSAASAQYSFLLKERSLLLPGMRETIYYDDYNKSNSIYTKYITST